LEAQQQERETRHAALARASLARFAEAPTPANLQFLFHPSYAIAPADLRKSVLDLAVCGMLAEPAPDDAELPSLKEFREAAASLANSLGLRLPKEPLDEAESPFDIPGHWRWIALADLGAAQTGTTPSKNDYEAFDGDIPFIKPADILPDGINYSNESLTRCGAESGSRLAPAGSLLMVCIGTIGKCNVIERECAFNQQINSLSPVQWIDSRYLLLAARASYFQDAAWRKSSSTTIAILNKGKWLSIPIPVPPLAEQRRIVAKVDQLMSLVNELQAQLATSHAAASVLIDAAVHELTSGKENHGAEV
jgi:type I restriction enzyme S subunit